MRRLLFPLALIFILSFAYYGYFFHHVHFPPKDATELLSRACSFDESQAIGLRIEAGPYRQASCAEAFSERRAGLTYIEGVVMRGRPFVLETTIVCQYENVGYKTHSVRCKTHTDGP